MLRSIITGALVAGALTTLGCQSKGGWWSNSRRTDTDYSVQKRAREAEHEGAGTSGSAQGNVDQRTRVQQGSSETAPATSTPGAGTPSSSKTSGNASGNDAAPRGDTVKPGGSR